MPGKRKRKDDKASIAARKAPKRQPGRPPNTRGPKIDTRVSRTSAPLPNTSKSRTLKNIKSKRKMALLEKLPTEILEVIFLYCRNINLPNASPIISAKLSSKTIYNKVILAAFGPTWTWAMNAIVVPPKPYYDELIKLQSTILRCRWAQLPILLNAKDVWWTEYQKEELSNVVSSPAEVTSLMPDNSESEEAQISAGMETIPRSSESMLLGNKFQAFCNACLDWDSRKPLKDKEEAFYICFWSSAIERHIGLHHVEIPHTLLSGPWDEEMLKYLFWLGQAGARVDWLHNTTGEVATDGLRQAIQLGDTRAVHILWKLGVAEKVDANLLIWTFRNAGGDKLVVIDQLLNLASVNSAFGIRTAQKLEAALEEMMHEARRRKDMEEYNLARDILKLDILTRKLGWV